MNLDNLFVCPSCKKHFMQGQCVSCGAKYLEENSAVMNFISPQIYTSVSAYEEAKRLIDFWGNGWSKRLLESDHSFLFLMNKDELQVYVDQSRAWHVANKTLMGHEVAQTALDGKIALNIGCGAGDEALILARSGAYCLAMDITKPAAEATHSLLQIIGGGVGFQGDARFLPLPDCSVDLIYSSGVLHHSTDLPRSISEIQRVLKPGGTAYIMLYAKWSITFIQEKLLGWSGEKAWETEGRRNPLTNTYSVEQCKHLLKSFSNTSISKRGGSIKNIAKIGRYLPTIFDPFIDKNLGANLNIVTTK